MRSGYTSNKSSIPKGTYPITDWDTDKPTDKYFHHFQRTTEVQINFGANYFPQLVGTPFEPLKRSEYDQFIKKHPTGWIIWDKVNGNTNFSDCEMILTNLDFPSFVLPYMWSGMMQGKSIKEGTIQQGNKKLNEKRIHPTQKPIILLRYLLHKYAPFDKPVLDAYTGSGSGMIAAMMQGFKVVGYEKELAHYESSMKRIANYLKQPTFFSYATM